MVSLSQRNGFAELPEGCIANILSWTTPKDAGRACAVYPLFRAAAESDTVSDKTKRMFVFGDSMEVLILPLMSNHHTKRSSVTSGNLFDFYITLEENVAI